MIVQWTILYNSYNSNQNFASASSRTPVSNKILKRNLANDTFFTRGVEKTVCAGKSFSADQVASLPLTTKYIFAKNKTAHPKAIRRRFRCRLGERESTCSGLINIQSRRCKRFSLLFHIMSANDYYNNQNKGPGYYPPQGMFSEM